MKTDHKCVAVNINHVNPSCILPMMQLTWILCQDLNNIIQTRYSTLAFFSPTIFAGGCVFYLFLELKAKNVNF